MAQVAIWVDSIADELLDFFSLWKAACLLAGENQLAIEADFQNAAFSWLEGHFSNIFRECRQQFLGEPSGSHHPTALATVENGNPRGF